MAKPRVVTDLQVWMIERGLTDGALAEAVTKKVPSKRAITERQVGRWRKGLAMPRYTEHLTALTELSGGKVTANSFVEAMNKDVPDAEGGP